ncbi:carboxylesterase, partial [Reticulomyxa filosa]
GIVQLYLFLLLVLASYKYVISFRFKNKLFISYDQSVVLLLNNLSVLYNCASQSIDPITTNPGSIFNIAMRTNPFKSDNTARNSNNINQNVAVKLKHKRKVMGPIRQTFRRIMIVFNIEVPNNIYFFNLILFVLFAIGGIRITTNDNKPMNKDVRKNKGNSYEHVPPNTLVQMKMKLFHLLVSAFLAFLSKGDDLVVQTNYGTIQGQLMSPTVRAFRKIPYARPPVGTLRWAPSVPPVPWGNKTVMATQDPPGCPQACGLPPLTCPTTLDEDCLYLNIFTPHPVNANTKYPVLVFIHGGNFKQGYGGGLLYNGTDFVNYTNSILVTMNYRLGALGFLWSAVGPKGNYGLEDQMLALQFVRDNIEFFGGDVNHITIFGQSAGAVSVALHLTQTQGESQLFTAAIMESEPYGLPIRDTASWGILPETFYNFLGCPYDLTSHDTEMFWDCLRNKTIGEIITAQVASENDVADEADHFLDLFMPWSPTAGTDLVTVQVHFFIKFINKKNEIKFFFFFFDIMRMCDLNFECKYLDVPFTIGTVADEGIEFVWMAYPNGLSREQVDEILVVMLGTNDAIRIREHYPMPNNVTDYRGYLSLIATDGLFVCPSRNASVSHYNVPINGNKNPPFIYYYHFDHVSSFNDQAWGSNYTFCDDVVCHGAELPYVFHTNLAPINSSFSPAEQQLALGMQRYWSTFAALGQPGNDQGGLNTYWTPFVLGTEASIMFQTNNVQMTNNYDLVNSQCAFWDTTNYNCKSNDLIYGNFLTQMTKVNILEQKCDLQFKK